MSMYNGQESDTVLPVLAYEHSHPDIMFTEADRTRAYRALASMSMDLNFYVRLLQQENLHRSHQASYFLQAWAQLGENKRFTSE